MPPLVPLKSLKPLDRCTINGYTVEVSRQARRTTFVRIVGGDLNGCTVQLPRDKMVAR
jgi:hypothetical protein